MRRLLMNAAMIPSPGIWRYEKISADRAAAWLRSHAATVESFVGYPQTAEHLSRLHGDGWVCPLNRQKVEGLHAGDEALICKLAYRVENPATKGQPQPEDWEYGILTMEERA